MRLDVRLFENDARTFLQENVPPNSVLELQVGPDYEERLRRTKIHYELWQARYGLDKTVAPMLQTPHIPARTSHRSFVALIRKEREDLDVLRRRMGVPTTAELLKTLENIDGYLEHGDIPDALPPVDPVDTDTGGTTDPGIVDGVRKKKRPDKGTKDKKSDECIVGDGTSRRVWAGGCLLEACPRLIALC